MSHFAAGTWSVQDAEGKRQFTYGKAEVKIGDLVRVMAYGYGATKNHVGREGLVVDRKAKRVVIEFADGSLRTIDPVVVGILLQPVLTPQGYGAGEDTIDLHACWMLDDAALARAILILTHEQSRRAAATATA